MSGINTIRSISRTYRHIDRYRKILGVLLKNGFGFLFNDLKVPLPFKSRAKVQEQGPEEVSRTTPAFAERLCATLVELGPTYVKLGQLLSCRPDILPPALVNELGRLRDHVPPFDFEQVREIIRQDLHGEIEDIFSSFDREPSGSASIGQGYHAVLKDGTEVFVKVQRPGIQKDINVDLEILAYFARQIEENSPELDFLKPTQIVEEFALSLKRELDFSNEMSNMISFAKQFSGNENIVVPKPYRKLCSRRVLTMDFIRGIKGNDYEGMRKAGVDLKKVAELGVKILLDQFFTYGFFHADPHAGNMFVLPGPKLCYVDFGVMGRLTKEEISTFGQLLTDIIMEKHNSAAKLILKMTTSTRIPDVESLERDVASLVDCHLKGNVEDLNVLQVVQDFYGICYRQKLCLKPHVYQMMKALGYADAMGRDMAPDFEIFAQIRPVMMDQALKRLNPYTKTQRTLENLGEWSEIIRWLPWQTKLILGKLLEGKITLHHSMDDMPDFRQIMTQSFNRLSAGIVLCGMLVSSAVVIHAGTPPLLYGVSLIGLAGFLMSLGLGSILLYFVLFRR